MEIVVLDRGFVYVAEKVWSASDELKLERARCIRRWGTTGGLAQLANEGPQKDTVIEGYVSVRVPLHAVIHRIECKESAWK